MTQDILMYLERKMRDREEGHRGSYPKKHSRHSSHHNVETYPVRAHTPRRDYEDYEDYEDYDDEDVRDYHSPKHLRLTKSEIMQAEEKLHNLDGTRGPHFDYQQAMQAAERIGIRFDTYTEKEFCLAMNMMYADYAHVIQKHSPPEKLVQICAELAKAFFDDPDGPEPSEKLALYVHCISKAYD